MSFISDHLYLCPGKGNWESIDLVGPIPSLDDSGLPKAAGNQLWVAGHDGALRSASEGWALGQVFGHATGSRKFAWNMGSRSWFYWWTWPLLGSMSNSRPQYFPQAPPPWRRWLREERWFGEGPKTGSIHSSSELCWGWSMETLGSRRLARGWVSKQEGWDLFCSEPAKIIEWSVERHLSLQMVTQDEPNTWQKLLKSITAAQEKQPFQHQAACRFSFPASKNSQGFQGAKWIIPYHSLPLLLCG